MEMTLGDGPDPSMTDLLGLPILADLARGAASPRDLPLMNMPGSHDALALSRDSCSRMILPASVSFS